MTIDLDELKANALKLKTGASPIADYCAEHDEVLALIEVAQAADDLMISRHHQRGWGEDADLSEEFDRLSAALAKFKETP